MRIVIIIIFSVILIAVSVQIYFIFTERNQLKTELDEINKRLEALLVENAELESEIEYFSHPENLEKELRVKFNYKKPDEKMMIIVP